MITEILSDYLRMRFSFIPTPRVDRRLHILNEFQQGVRSKHAGAPADGSDGRHRQL